VEALGDTTDGVTTFGSEDDLCGRVVESLVHLIATGKMVINKYLTSESGRGTVWFVETEPRRIDTDCMYRGTG
jgi:hypothetical protein